MLSPSYDQGMVCPMADAFFFCYQWEQGNIQSVSEKKGSG